jgi:hypothetical protein
MMQPLNYVLRWDSTVRDAWSFPPGRQPSVDFVNTPKMRAF